MYTACRRMPVICCKLRAFLPHAATCHMLQVERRLAACRMLHASYCLLLVTCFMLHAVCFNSKCCNSWTKCYICFMFLVPCFCCLPHAASLVACCVLQAACPLMYFHVPDCNTGRHATYRSLFLVPGSLHSDCMLFTGSLCI